MVRQVWTLTGRYLHQAGVSCARVSGRKARGSEVGHTKLPSVDVTDAGWRDDVQR